MMPDRFDRVALQRGLVVALVVALPAGVISGHVNKHSTVALVLFLAIMAALIVGAMVAAEQQRTGFPLVHGIIAAVGAVLITQVVGVIGRVISGSDIRAIYWVSNLLLGLIAGTVGGLIGSRRQVH
jgi:hypothetical protein